jgi:glycosyltransferase involved in cell wall biosynthesis
LLVSCVMPTYNRREFIPLAIRSYLHQDWPEKELIVVADGEDVTDLFVGVPNVTYLFRDEHESLGRKKNLGNEFASGEIIAHWDDDDWSGPGRLTDQVNRILESGKSGHRLQRPELLGSQPERSMPVHTAARVMPVTALSAIGGITGKITDSKKTRKQGRFELCTRSRR